MDIQRPIDVEREPRSWTYYAAALVASLLPALLSAVLVWQVRAADYESAGKSALNTAKLIAYELDNTFDDFDALLKSIGRQYVDGVEKGPEEHARLAEFLKEELVDFPFVARTFVADLAGAFVLGGGVDFKYPPSGATVVDRDYFKRAAAGGNGG